MCISNNTASRHCFVVQWKSLSQVWKNALVEVLRFFSEINETHWMNSQSSVWPPFNFRSASSLHKYTAWRTNHRSDDIDIIDLQGPHNHQGYKFATNHTPSWCCCMIDKYLPVFLIIDNTINPNPNLQLYFQKHSPNFQGNSIMLHWCLQTLIIELFALLPCQRYFFLAATPPRRPLLTGLFQTTWDVPGSNWFCRF